MSEVKGKLILAIEMGLEPGSISILRDSDEIASVVGEDNASRSSDLIPVIKEILVNQHIKLSELTLIAVSNGPGSFTGVRVGLATARGLSMGSSIPCYGISSLEALAKSAERSIMDGVVRSVISTGRGSLIYRDFQVENEKIVKPVSEINSTSLESINDADWVNGVELMVLDNKLNSLPLVNAIDASINLQPLNLAKFIGLAASERIPDSVNESLKPIYARGI